VELAKRLAFLLTVSAELKEESDHLAADGLTPALRSLKRTLLLLLASIYAISLNLATAAEPEVKEKPEASEPATKAPKGSRGKDSDWEGKKEPKPQTETMKKKDKS
jgi:hypothetical protein